MVMFRRCAKEIVALVTGGASGLGRATAERLVQAGSKVVIYDRPQSAGEDVAKELGNNCLFVPGDVVSEAEVQNALDETTKTFGRLDAAINCAGMAVAFKTYNFNKGTCHQLEDFARILMVNTVGTFNVIRLAVGLIGKNEPDENGQRGVVINTSGTVAYDGQMGQAAYAASNAANISMTLPISRDLANVGIRCCTIAPGVFNTSLISGLPDEIRDFMGCVSLSPHRIGKSEEFAHMVQFIIENPMINGEVIRLDGGMRMPY